MADNEFFVVGLGASAGGLHAYQQLLPELKNENACYIVCQHLSPHHTSMLSDILSRSCALPILDLHDNEELLPGRVYVTPPNKNIEINNGHVTLIKPSGETIPKPNINQFFSSLGQYYADKAVGVVLSGSGSDGAIGLSTIHASGGLTLVQSPKSAEYDGMPRAALETSQVDYVGSPRELANYINSLLEGKNAHDLEVAGDVFEQILKYMTAVTGIDFDNYRFTTLIRRITRRMALLQIDDPTDYLQLIKKNRDEVNAFIQSAFIHVSSLYRDIEPFNQLSEYIETMLRSDEQLRDLRIWVPGCAMGEEAVTLAILLEDIRRRKKIPFHYKIFATDISVAAINKARTCLFEYDRCENLPEQMRRDYFDDVGNALEVKSVIREHIVFSVHNLLTDPPFSRMHIISCRNLLIYFKVLLQEDVTNLFNYSLQGRGLLLLGSSESLRGNQCFEVLDETNKLYRKIRDTDRAPLYLRYKTSKGQSGKVPAKPAEAFNLEFQVYKSVAELEGYATGVIDESNNLRFTHGGLNDFLQPQQGIITQQIFDLIHSDLRAELRALVFKARRTLQTALSASKDIAILGSPQTVHMTVMPLHVERPNWVLVCIKKDVNTSINKGKVEGIDKDPSLLELEQELTVTRENLQTVVEELETANEQLQVYNEELQSSNEEYQSTNEELQTINEELQSTNEELLTVNEELNQKNREQERLSTDLFNIQESLDLPLFLLDNEFRVQRFTKRCSLLADTSRLRIGDVFFALAWLHDMPDLRKLISAAADDEKIIEKELTISGNIFRLRASPYLNHQSVHDGTVVSFYDITHLKQAQQALVIERDIAETTLGSLSECVIRINAELKIDYLNPAAERFLQWSGTEAIGTDVSKLVRVFDDKVRIDLKHIVQQSINENTVYAPTDTFYTAKGRFGEDRLIEMTVTPIFSSDHLGKRAATLTIKDVTERQSHLDNLLWSSKHDALTGLVNRKEVEHRIRNTIAVAKESDVESCLLYLDLDQFKVVNDTCGHMAGDQLLKQISELIQHNIRSRDTLARLGGDEFAVLLEKCPIIKAEQVAKLILDAVGGYSFYWDERAFKVGVSIGLVAINRHTESLHAVLSDADAACYLAKEQGRNQIQIHDQFNDILELQRNQMKIVSDINDALENDRLRTYFQEIRCVSDPDVPPRWEALVRMFNQEGKFLLPDTFLPAAERFGLINRIDKWVFESVVNTLKQYFPSDSMPIININVSAYTIGDESYFSLVESLLVENKIPFSQVCFELTETAAMSNTIKCLHFIDKVRSLGCNIAIDDFGTGMSSLAYLTELPVTSVKLDGKFTQSIGNGDVNHVIVDSVTQVAHKLSMTVVAEAVESQQQMEALRELGVDFIQGYYLRRPIPTEEFVSLYKDSIDHDGANI
ncbi:EAL domain-containing protein [Aestuariibacter salexigens]|uniref:EAL domain-containing protein n=1 Tax=Aestuariibacter salexigens TaxID=226010 RepID=UPI0004242465|nr:EAL domain-containing protein [Aestuariibacter salexigens]